MESEPYPYCFSSLFAFDFAGGFSQIGGYITHSFSTRLTEINVRFKSRMSASKPCRADWSATCPASKVPPEEVDVMLRSSNQDLDCSPIGSWILISYQ